MYKEILSRDDYAEFLSDTDGEAVFVFKHSTVCPVSASALEQFSSFVKKQNRDQDVLVPVREAREVSDQIEKATGVQHESPQAILLKNGRALWNASHGSITEDSLSRALEKAKQAE